MQQSPREFDEATLTDAVIEAVSAGKDERVKTISRALIKHLHAFIREIEPTEVEWKAGIDFLTETGQMCSDTRQEFILLSDTLGVSMLVDAINHRFPGHATETTVFGPFYVEPPTFENGADMSGHLSGTPLYVSGTVTDESGTLLANAKVDVWHSDEDGFYDLQKFDQNPAVAGRGRVVTNNRGAFSFWTVRPTAYPIPDDGPVGGMLKSQGRHPFRPEHIHFMISEDRSETLVTHLFARGDKYLESDVVFGVKHSLIVDYQVHNGGVSPDGVNQTGKWLSLKHDFVLAKK